MATKTPTACPMGLVVFVAGCLMIPAPAWVAFATALDLAIWQFNFM